MKYLIKPTFLNVVLSCLFALLSFTPKGFSQQTPKIFPGADQKTPSRSEYFSWINNTNEGTTEKQTLRNLDFFQWLYDEYGMKLDIYAFDAGAIDGAGYYGSNRSSRFKTQFPNGFYLWLKRPGRWAPGLESGAARMDLEIHRRRKINA